MSTEFKNDSYTTPMTEAGRSAPETTAEKIARLRRDRAKADDAYKEALELRTLQKEELIAKYSQALGRLGSEFVIVDTGHTTDPLIVVKRPLPIQFDKYSQSDMKPADRYDYIAPSIVEPSPEDYRALRMRRAGIDIGVANALQPMMGNGAEIEAGK